MPGAVLAATQWQLVQQLAAGLAPLQVCLQVNISGEASKSGLAPAEVAAVAHAVAALPRLRLRGLMSIPKPWPDLEQRRAGQAQRIEGAAKRAQQLDAPAGAGEEDVHYYTMCIRGGSACIICGKSVIL